MKVGFVKISPTQNMTILVTTPVERELQPHVASQLMDYSNVYAEQVGFIETPTAPDAIVRLQMMGGEFCGNATMACASYIADKRGLHDGSETDILIEVSGAEKPLECHITRRDNAYFGTVGMPVPNAIKEVKFVNGLRCPVVFFPGIAHAVLDDHGEDDTSIIAGMCEELHEEAFGILRRNSETNYIRPLVYVASTQSAVYERGCGSGASALIALRAFSSKADANADISQPGGVINAHARYSAGRVSEITITGRVTVAAEGTAYID